MKKIVFLILFYLALACSSLAAINISSTAVSQHGLNDGTASVSVSCENCSNTAFEYSVDGGAFQLSGAFYNLAAGEHTATVRLQGTGCAYSKLFLVPDALVPVWFMGFNVQCLNGLVILRWETAQEINAQRFDVEHSRDGVNWTVAGSVKAKGNSAFKQSYSFTDSLPGDGDHYYRVAEIDEDGSKMYTSVMKSSCILNEEVSVWPNPAGDFVVIEMALKNASPVKAELYDAKGAQVSEREALVQPGKNQLRMMVKDLPAGVYVLKVSWKAGKREIKVLKN